MPTPYPAPAQAAGAEPGVRRVVWDATAGDGKGRLNLPYSSWLWHSTCGRAPLAVLYEQKGPTVSLEETIATQLRARGWHLALAETTTGGIIAVRLVRLAGSSAYFDRSIVAYSKEAKVQSLGVDPAVFERSGAVSVATACAMAEGLQRLTHADIVLAETGIAGPIRGRSPKPLGSTCFAMHTPTGMVTDDVQFDGGERQAIQEQIAEHALEMIARYLTTAA